VESYIKLENKHFIEMGLTNKQKYMLFILGEYYNKERGRLKKEFLDIAISKPVFIDLVLSSGLVSKKSRAVYKNLEMLERKKLIYYENRMLKMTALGLKRFQELEAAISPYLIAMQILKSGKARAKKTQSVFSE